MTEDAIEHIKKSVSIKPLNSGGSNFKTNVLVEKQKGVLQYIPSTGLLAFLSIFLMVGISFLVFGVYKVFFSNEYHFDFGHVIFAIVSFVFLSVSTAMAYQNYKPNVFNKLTGRYTKGFVKNKIKKKSIDISLSKIIALQLIGEIVPTDKGSYNSFELNIVLDDGERFNVVDHGNLKTLIADAEWLSEFLNKPIWHAKSSKK